MGLFEQWPYTNLHTLNLDWILESLKELEHTIEQFVSINALKYADPIQWNITKQYEKNTIVIDPLTGTAYISVQPVPAGVALTRDEYWTVVFDLGGFVVRAAKNFTNRYEDATTLTATFPTAASEWVVWGDTLYKALVNITAGDQYVVDSNIQHFTMEDVIGHLEDLTTTDKSNLVVAINEIAAEVLGKIGDLDDLNTTDKSNLVAAINDVLVIMANITGDLADLTTTDKSNLVAAINEIAAEVLGKIGDLNDLNTTDKSNLVAAINEIENKKALKADIINVINMVEAGCVGDGVTDNKTLIEDIIAAAPRGSVLYFERGDYYLSDMVDITKQLTIMGDGGLSYDPPTRFITDAGAFMLSASGITLQDFKVIANAHTDSGIRVFNSWCQILRVGVDDAVSDNSKYFENSIEIGDATHNCDFTYLSDVQINVKHRAGGAITIAEMNGSGLKIVGGTNIVISNSFIQFKKYGINMPPIQYQGHYVDGITFDNLNIVWCNYGFYAYNMRAGYFTNLIIDQIARGIYFSECEEIRISNSHFGCNTSIGITPSTFLELYKCKLITIESAFLFCTGTTDYGLKIGECTDVFISNMYIYDIDTGIEIDSLCTVYGENVICDTVNVGVNTAYSGSKTFIENVTGATTNYQGTTFKNPHIETITGSDLNLGNTTNYFNITIPTKYDKIPDNVVFTITANTVTTRAIMHQYDKSNATTYSIPIILFTADGVNFNNEVISYSCTCIYD